jgi:hypothetical protein
MTLFSKRNRPAPEEYRYDIPRDARLRIMHALNRIAGDMANSLYFDRLLNEIGQKLLIEYGGLCAPGYDAARVSDDPVIQHFMSCDDDMALDFIETLFHTMGWGGGQQTVEAINTVFRDEAIGYELTEFSMKLGKRKGPRAKGEIGEPLDVRYPQILTKDSEFLHSEVVQPALQVLVGDEYAGANEEFMKAHEHYRHQRYQECLNECLKAFESTMKIICHEKGWAFQQTDTASKLIKVCLDKGLIPTFSEQQLTSLRTLLESGVPTVRNKRAGHGQGTQRNEVPAHLAQYALHITAATILLLAECAR